MFALASTSRDVPAPVRFKLPALRAPSVPERTSEVFVALVKNWNWEDDLSKPKKPILAEPS